MKKVRKKFFENFSKKNNTIHKKIFFKKNFNFYLKVIFQEKGQIQQNPNKVGKIET